MSFTLIAYVSAWLKCYELAAFLRALLNSQLMGFYTPAQLLQNAQEHGVEVQPVDVSTSGWDYTLTRGALGEPTVRLGLRMVKGSPVPAPSACSPPACRLRSKAGDLARRAALHRRDLKCLAMAGALEGRRSPSPGALGGARHYSGLRMY